MEQILLAYGIPKETVAAITILYRNTKVKVRSPDGDREYFDIVAGVLQWDTLAPYLFIICQDYVLRTSIDKIKENGFELSKKISRRYPAKTITDADYADDKAETLLHSLERAAAGIGLYVNAHKTEYMCYNQTGDISTLEGTPLKLVDKFTYLGSSVESTEKDIETRLMKAWTAINRLSIIWKSDLTDKMKRSFFQAVVISILLYGCTTWTLTKRLEKKLDGNYTRMLRAILNKTWRQHPTRHQLCGHLPSITKTIQARRTRHAGHCWRSRDELIRDVLLWTPTHGRAKSGRPARTYIQQLCEDTGCCPEDLPRAMNDREEWRDDDEVIAFVCLHFIPYQIPECSIRSKSFPLCERQPWIPWPRWLNPHGGERIYCHPQTDCFVVSQLFSVVKHAGRYKLGSKPV